MASSNKKSSQDSGLWLAIGCLLLLTCMACLVISSAGLIIFAGWFRVGTFVEPVPETSAQITTPYPGLNPAPTLSPTADQKLLPTETSDVVLPSPIPGSTLTPVVAADPTDEPPEVIEDLPAAQDALSNLLEMNYPPRDYFESARRLGSSDLGSRTVPSDPPSLGDKRPFRTDDGLRDAELVAITEHAYFWVESSLNFDRQQFYAAAEQFERDYYPVVTALFGNEWQPGVDGDPRFSIFHLDGYADDSELGFFNSGDEYPRSVYNNSNEHELIYLNMANLQFGDQVYYGTLIHEFQHLIQWHHDSNEPVWFSEGLAQFTELYVGLDTVDSQFDYLANPSVQLNSWNYEDEEELLAHYGAAYLFTVYIWEQLGEQALVEMVRHPADGLGALHWVMQQLQSARTIEQFLADWLVANYLDAEESNSRYGYDSLNLPRVAHTRAITQLPATIEELIEPLSAQYFDLELTGTAIISFTGEVAAELFPALPFDSAEAWYVPGLNETDAHLTATFDLRNANDAELNFWTWYDLEEDFDFAYVTISTDGGETWDFLIPDHATAGTFGPAFSGRSQDEVNQVSGWLSESVSLWRYGGQEVVIRIEVLTDSAITGGGFAIGDIGVSQFDGAQEGDWLAQGFVRTGPDLPHAWTVQLIQKASGQQVVPMQLDQNNQGKLIADLGDEGGVLVVGFLTPYVDQPAAYHLSIEASSD
jgi:immune inhibitor A